MVSCSAVRPDGGLAFLNRNDHIFGMGLYLTDFQRKYSGPLRDIFPEATGVLRLYIWENKRKEFIYARKKLKAVCLHICSLVKLDERHANGQY